MIKIITIDREYGSGAADIAAKLASRLGWKLWDELLTIEIARILGCDCPAVEEREERRDTLHYRLFKAFLRGSFEGTLNVQRGKMVDAECIREASEKVVREAAGQGNSVLVGRGSAYYLQPNPDAFHVFVYAPF
jgi:cytidylate kinase